MTKPRRIQRKMSKGWRLPPGTIYVGRGSKWGNPFPFGHQVYLGKAWAVDAYAQWLRTSLKGMALVREHLHELRDKNLACWCKAGEACHADVLLALANEEHEHDSPPHPRSFTARPLPTGERQVGTPLSPLPEGEAGSDR